jgi:hypothetical protein
MAYCLPEIGKMAARIATGPEALASMDPAWL